MIILESTKRHMIRLLDEVMYQEGPLKSCWNNLTDNDKMFIAEGLLDIAVVNVRILGAKE